jgi:hypothetical protein
MALSLALLEIGTAQDVTERQRAEDATNVLLSKGAFEQCMAGLGRPGE